MKRLLLVSDEKTPQDQGKITDSARYGLAPELYNLPNLREAISRQGDFEIVTRSLPQRANGTMLCSPGASARAI